MQAIQQHAAFVAMEANRLLSNEIAGLKPLVIQSGAPSKALYIDFDCPFGAFYDAEVSVGAFVDALRPAVRQLAKAIKRGHIKRFYRGELPRFTEAAYQAVGPDIALMFMRFWSMEKCTMVNRLQLLGAVRH